MLRIYGKEVIYTSDGFYYDDVCEITEELADLDPSILRVGKKYHSDGYSDEFEITIIEHDDSIVVLDDVKTQEDFDAYWDWSQEDIRSHAEEYGLDTEERLGSFIRARYYYLSTLVPEFAQLDK